MLTADKKARQLIDLCKSTDVTNDDDWHTYYTTVKYTVNTRSPIEMISLINALADKAANAENLRDIYKSIIDSYTN